MQPQSHNSVQSPPSHSVRVDAAGRIVVPADLRQECHIVPGQHVILEADQGRLTVRSYDQVIDDLQDFCADVAPSDLLLSEELIQERRAEAIREHQELTEPAGSDE